MFGTVLNVVGILAGGIAGLTRKHPLTNQTEASLKVLLGAATVWTGLSLTWRSLEGTLGQWLGQLAIAVVSLMLGRATGRLLGLQRFSNGLGQSARELIAAALPGRPDAAAGFKTCALLFCAAPLAILGSVQDGLSGYFYPLLIKAVIDGLATMGFVAIFGWGATLAVVPVLAFQGSITLFCLLVLKPWLAPDLVNSILAVGGLLVFSVSLVLLNLKKLELADYLPSLAYAPLLTFAARHL